MVEVVIVSVSEQLICCQGKVVRIELLNYTSYSVWLNLTEM